jgi:hypothetical protein
MCLTFRCRQGAIASRRAVIFGAALATMPSLAHASDDSKAKADKLAKQMAVVNFTVGSLPFMSHAQQRRRRCHLLSFRQRRRGGLGGNLISEKMGGGQFPSLSASLDILLERERAGERDREMATERLGAKGQCKFAMLVGYCVHAPASS